MIIRRGCEKITLSSFLVIFAKSVKEALLWIIYFEKCIPNFSRLPNFNSPQSSSFKPILDGRLLPWCFSTMLIFNLRFASFDLKAIVRIQDQRFILCHGVSCLDGHPGYRGRVCGANHK